MSRLPDVAGRGGEVVWKQWNGLDGLDRYGPVWKCSNEGEGAP